jgi:hypothetical protein
MRWLAEFTVGVGIVLFHAFLLLLERSRAGEHS